MRQQSIIRVTLGSALLLACGFAASIMAADDQPSDEAGFVSLFDGKTLDGWQGATNGYEVVDGAITCKPKSGGNLYTKKEYSDFTLRLEIRMEPGTNNGIGLRTPLQGDAAFVAMESQVLDDSHASYKGIKDWQAHGSIYGVVAAKRGHLKKAGEWNTQEITCKGRHVTIKLNGVTIVDADIDQASNLKVVDGKETRKTVDGREHPGLSRKSGHIGFLGHGSKVEFRKIRIKELN